MNKSELRNQIKTSRRDALNSIKKFLEAENIETQFANRDGNYYSKEKFIVTWNGYKKSMFVEFSLELTERSYAHMFDVNCILVCRNLVYEEQLKAFKSIERGLLESGLDLCKDNEEKKEFFARYVVPYNERIMQRRV